MPDLPPEPLDSPKAQGLVPSLRRQMCQELEDLPLPGSPEKKRSATSSLPQKQQKPERLMRPGRLSLQMRLEQSKYRDELLKMDEEHRQRHVKRTEERQQQQEVHQNSQEKLRSTAEAQSESRMDTRSSGKVSAPQDSTPALGAPNAGKYRNSEWVKSHVKPLEDDGNELRRQPIVSPLASIGGRRSGRSSKRRSRRKTSACSSGSPDFDVLETILLPSEDCHFVVASSTPHNQSRKTPQRGRRDSSKGKPSADSRPSGKTKTHRQSSCSKSPSKSPSASPPRDAIKEPRKSSMLEQKERKAQTEQRRRRSSRSKEKSLRKSLFKEEESWQLDSFDSAEPFEQNEELNKAMLAEKRLDHVKSAWIEEEV
eukprot:TRINITY_DN8289_c3_g1_i1.p1 TRINITY_DN8289_c3_g1~~TRINITY_DN8289_c3_g1_i1.p1  ORF type:complete len:369 (-),score=70.58 TRINITY_DN8289_c3_g1_i1:69-1175(-)